MRIINENSQPFEAKTKDFLQWNTIEITDEGWDEIANGYDDEMEAFCGGRFHEYLYELIELKRSMK
jgi:hypothetical protein